MSKEISATVLSTAALLISLSVLVSPPLHAYYTSDRTCTVSGVSGTCDSNNNLGSCDTGYGPVPDSSDCGDQSSCYSYQDCAQSYPGDPTMWNCSNNTTCTYSGGGGPGSGTLSLNTIFFNDTSGLLASYTSIPAQNILLNTTNPVVVKITVNDTRQVIP